MSWAVMAMTLMPAVARAHPLGNFTISQYSALRIAADHIEVRYVIDMAEIPTFQAIQDSAMTADPAHPTARQYLAKTVQQLTDGLVLEVNGRRLALRAESTEILFPPGAGDLPTLKLGVRYRVALPAPADAGPRQLRYRDGNFPDRAGWKEIIAVGDGRVTLTSSSVPEKDRSQKLSDYPVDLLNSPPQDLEARIVFVGERMAASAGRARGDQPPAARQDQPAAAVSAPSTAGSTSEETPTELRANRQGMPRNTFTELVTTKELGPGVVLTALAVAVALGAFHALEPGHGKTVVGAYLVGSRGSARHALLLGLVVTASHTAGVYLLGAVTLYASRYIVPERLYPWLGATSGLFIAVLGFTLFLRRYAGLTSDHGHSHGHGHGYDHHDHVHPTLGGAHEHVPHQHHGHGPGPGAGAVTLPGLVALGVSGGIVPCPAALVVLLSALSLNRVGFGLLLIVAFSVGLAAVLIVIGMLMVYAGHFMGRLHGEGPLIQRWLPLASSIVITVLGLGIALQALTAAGIVQVRF